MQALLKMTNNNNKQTNKQTRFAHNVSMLETREKVTRNDDKVSSYRCLGPLAGNIIFK